MHSAVQHQAPIQIVSRTSVVGREATKPSANCSSCHLKALCLPRGLPADEVTQLDGLQFTRRRVLQGQPLYHAGEKFANIYAVRSGSFKSSLALADGREQVSGFHVAGELMGMDGLGHGEHASSAEALEDADVCVIPYAQLSEVARTSRSGQHLIGRLMSREITREHQLMMLLGSMNAEERLAAFLLNLSERMRERGYSSSEFHLRMSRADIGSYLGMKLETVSRTFSHFQRQGVLEVDKKHVRITDMARLGSTFETRVH